MCNELGFDYESFNNIRQGKVQYAPAEMVKAIAGRYPEFENYLKIPTKGEGDESDRLRQTIEMYEARLLEKDDANQTLKAYIADLKAIIEILKNK